MLHVTLTEEAQQQLKNVKGMRVATVQVLRRLPNGHALVRHRRRQWIMEEEHFARWKKGEKRTAR